MTVNPYAITNFNRSTEELEELLCFCIAVAGHNAKTTAAALDVFLAPCFEVRAKTSPWNAPLSPFAYIRQITGSPPWKGEEENLILYGVRAAVAWRKLISKVKSASIGMTTKVSRGFWEAAWAELDLRNCSVEDLERLFSVGRKTSRFFAVHSRSGLKDVAVLDTHVLKYLGSLGHKVPKNTPSTKKEYERLERAFITEANKAGKTIADFDLEVWKRGATKSQE